MLRSPAHYCLIATLMFSMFSLVLTGCEKTGSRIDPYESTKSDLNSKQASIPALLEFSDLTAQRLAQDITSIPQVRDSSERLVLELGSIENRTRTATTDFELIQRRLRSQLMRSDVVRRNFMIVEGRQRMDSELQRVAGVTDSTTARYNPADTFVLQGDFFEARRGDRSQFFFNFKLTNLATRELVFDSDYDLAQLRPDK